ncbi:hypothetical protein VTN96DRAFT_9658 [Rasamsonia emersonii]|uniref:Lipocalin-like domain-containing protein n=1 Tax=Rasamsonia emersonii (strain ATCC 16479 / CBS 393.64 / IMI 116815) TaxID=1408163 RepID=A0A0F4Z0I1_RASE3|nr:hypothetical protein T310_2627 [Rasamsonia emersonii CBS 393.64]KKA23373.1 hypothetical protein T310_2627 [Rasamsonia emersonii CBS 393.64]
MSNNQGPSSFSFSFRWKTVITLLAILLPALALAFSNPLFSSSLSSLLPNFNYPLLSADETIVNDAAHIQTQLLGTWHLESFELRIHLPGPPLLAGLTIWTHYPLRHNPRGLLLYTADGYMSAQLMQQQQQQPGSCARFAHEAYQLASDTELACAARRYLAYSGTYTVDVITDTNTKLAAVAVVNHSVHVSLFPNWLGTTQTRIVQLKDDRLMLVPLEEGLPRWKVRKKSTEP